MWFISFQVSFEVWLVQEKTGPVWISNASQQDCVHGHRSIHHLQAHTYMYIYIYTHTYIYMYICSCGSSQAFPSHPACNTLLEVSLHYGQNFTWESFIISYIVFPSLTSVFSLIPAHKTQQSLRVEGVLCVSPCPAKPQSQCSKRDHLLLQRKKGKHHIRAWEAGQHPKDY